MSAPLAILIVHGLVGFGRIQAWQQARRYFHDLDGRLGPDVFFPVLPGNARILDRGATLAAYLRRLPHPRVAIIAHSMGGLDARHAIHALDPGRRVRELVTLSTPHRGSAMAERTAHGRGPFPALTRSLLRPALDDLRPRACEAFNAMTPDRPDVRYRSYSATRPREDMPLWLRPFADRMGDEPNDGLVSVRSAIWGEHVATLSANHFELAGWRVLPFGAGQAPPFDHRTFYRDLVAELRAAHG